MNAQMGEHEKEFISHVSKYHRMYGTKEEYYYRLGLFTANYYRIKAHNAKHAEE